MIKNEEKNGSLMLNELFHRIVDFKNDSGKVIEFVPPQTLEKELEVRMKKENKNSDLIELAEFVMKNSVDTSHPYFVNQLYGGVHPTALAASFIAEKMNTNAHTYEVAPVFVLAERIVLKELRKIFYGSEEGDGLFTPGGSLANMTGYVLARHQRFPNIKKQGLFGVPPLVMYTSEDGHYSASKAANWMGFGLDNVVKIKTDKNGAMIPEELEFAIQISLAEGKQPLIVNATAGTTVLGAFDDFDAISEICKREKVWLHCDAAWGGSFIFSPKLRSQNLNGIEKCDSIAWNAHKMLGVPLQCSAFITRHKNSLSACNSLNASYLFQPDKYYPIEYDESGDKTVQCGRKCDAFKLWFMWAAIGTDGFKELVENTEDCARYFADKIRSREDCILYLDKQQCTNVYFWFIPKRLRNHTRDDIWWKEIGLATTQIKERMVLEGSMMIGYSPLPHKNLPNALRLVLPANPPKTHDQMDFLIQSIVTFGIDL